MASETHSTEKTAAMERRKRKAEGLPKNPRMEKLQKHFEVKAEPPDHNREMSDSTSNGGGGSQSAASEISEDDDEDDDDGDEAGEDKAEPDRDDEDAESSSSSDTDALSSSDSEGNDDGDGAEPVENPRDAQPAVLETPANATESQIQPSKDDSSLLLDRSNKRMKTYNDALENYETGHRMASSAISSIAEEHISQVFCTAPTAALELVRLRSELIEHLKSKRVGDTQLHEMEVALVKAQNSALDALLEETRKMCLTLRKANPTAPRNAMHEEQSSSAQTVLVQQAEERQPLARPEQTVFKTSDNTASNERKRLGGPLHPGRTSGNPSLETTTPSATPSVASNAVRIDRGHIQQGCINSMPQAPSRTRPQRDKPGAINEPFLLFGRHVSRAVRESPDIAIHRLWARARGVWEGLLSAERQEWGELYTRCMVEINDFASSFEPAKDLMSRHKVLDRVKELDAGKNKATTTGLRTDRFNPPAGPSSVSRPASRGGGEFHRPSRS